MNIKELDEKSERLHRIWWDFSNYMKEWYSGVDDRLDVEQIIGDEASERVYEYIKTHPEIKIVPCDDNHFMSSDIVLVPHPTMGITVIYIPQCCSSINQFFLYPGHMNCLIEAIEEMKAKYITVENLD